MTFYKSINRTGYDPPPIFPNIIDAGLYLQPESYQKISEVRPFNLRCFNPILGICIQEFMVMMNRYRWYTYIDEVNYV